MRLLYVASDQVVPGRTGGSVHVLEVARGLAARGHEVHAIIHQAAARAPHENEGRLHWHRISWTPPHRFFRFRAERAVAAIAESVRPQAVIERYYNFGGEGIRVAASRKLPSLLEVNSPLLDHPGSLKGALDALLLVRPMRRVRYELCRKASALVAPILEIVPEFARAKTQTLSWGANVDAFHPARRNAALRRELGVPEQAKLVLFSGSFRPWHGVHVFEAAARLLARREDLYFLLVGGETGPASGYRGRRLGAQPYERMPAIVASADIGVAPYDTSRLGQLQLGFYWSPLKIFEYMASGIPTLTIPRVPLTEILREGQDGLHFRERDADDLALKLEVLADDPALRARLGASSRERVVARYSWARHCEQLEAVLERIAA
jgi:glycosyltransferase involved in cell wall biosynthesis